MMTTSLIAPDTERNDDGMRTLSSNVEFRPGRRPLVRHGRGLLERGERPSRWPVSWWCAIAGLALWLVAGCAHDAGGPDRESFDLQFDLRSFGGAAALGNGASVLARISLSIGLPNQDGSLVTQNFDVAPTDSMVETTVDLSPGPYSFIVNAVSNNGTFIYFLSTVAFLGDGSNVVLVPQATDGVLVVSPADAGLGDDLLIRNVGNRAFTWVATCVDSQTGPCANGFYGTPLRGTLAPGASTTMRVCSFLGTNAVFSVGFSSNVGTVLVRKAARQVIPGTTINC
jgi:hypothetical protein